MPEVLRKQIFIVGIIAVLMLALISWIAYGFGYAVIERKWVLGSDQRAIAIARVFDEMNDNANNRVLKTVESRQKIASIIREFSIWSVTDEFRELGYPNAEIRPVDPQTGTPLIPSVVSGKIKDEPLKSLNTISSKTTQGYVINGEGAWVIRISGLVTFGLNTVVVNSDIPIRDIVNRHWKRMAWHGVLMVLIIFQALRIIKMPKAARTDKYNLGFSNNDEIEMLKALIDALDVDACIAEVDESTKRNKIAYTNLGLAHRMGYTSREQLIGKPLETFLPDEKRDKHIDYVYEFYMSDDAHRTARMVEPITRTGDSVKVNLSLRKAISTNVLGKKRVVAIVRD